jgi:hypothetical protein
MKDIKNSYVELLDTLVSGDIITEAVKTDLLKEAEGKLEATQFEVSTVEPKDYDGIINYVTGLSENSAISEIEADDVLLGDGSMFKVVEILPDGKLVLRCLDGKDHGPQIGDGLQVGEKLEEDISEDLGKEIEDTIRDTVEKATQKYKDELKKLTANLEEAAEKPETDDKIDDDVEIGKPQSIKSVLSDFLSVLPPNNLASFNKLAESLTEEQKLLFSEFLDGEVSDFSKDLEISGIEEGLKDLEDGEREKLKNVTDFITERVSEVDRMYKTYQREYARLMKAQLATFKKQQRTLKLSGGILGKAEHRNLFQDVFARHNKQLQLKESTIAAVRKILDDRNGKIERLISEKVKSEGEQQKLLMENGKINKLYEDTLSQTKLLKESVILSEAKAFLAESVRGVPTGLKDFLMNEFRNSPVDKIKANLTEAIEAYNSEEKERRSSLRKNASLNRTGNNLIFEAKEIKQQQEEVDPLIAGIMESVKRLEM